MTNFEGVGENTHKVDVTFTSKDIRTSTDIYRGDPIFFFFWNINSELYDSTKH